MPEVVECGKFEEMEEGIGVEIELVELVLTVVEWEEAGEVMVG